MKEFIVEESVHVRSDNNTSKMMKHLLIALIPIILFSFYKNGIMPYANGNSDFFEMIYPLVMIFIGCLTSVVLESIYAIFIKGVIDLKEYIKSSYAFFPGLFLGLILPISTPLHYVVLGSFVGTIIAKMIFGGFGKNIFNPALLGYLFLFIVFPTNFTSTSYLNNAEIDAVTTATPLTNLQNLDFVGSYNEVVAPFGSNVDMFLGFRPGSGAETCILLCLLAFAYLVFFKVIKARIPLVYVGTVFLITMFIGYNHNMDIWYPIFSIMSGGLIFGAIFMATDPVTSPTTNIGQIVYAIMLGILTILFRYLMPYPEGVMFAILIMNLFAIIIDILGAYARLDFKKNLLMFGVPILIGLGVMFYASSTLITAETTTIDKNYKIISKTSDTSSVYYTVSEKCFYVVKAKITIDKASGKIKTILITENSETFYNKVESENYIEKLVNNQDDLSKLDTISGATRTSGGLKRMVQNTLDDFKTNGI